MKHLVIVESPAKAKKIGEYLGPDFRVEASIGHIRDLPAKNMGVDIAGGFIPEYEISPQKKKRVSELKSYAKSADKVWIMTDPDREGEAIGWHLCHALGLDIPSTPRVIFHEITKGAIQKAIASPGHINIDLVNAQQSRRILDRIVGYEVSPVLWRKVRAGLSAGRVQSVAVKLLVEREREIRAFVPEETWKITTPLSSSQPLTVELAKRGGKSVKIRSKDELAKLLGAYGVTISDDIYQKDKKGNLLCELPWHKDFTLSDREVRSSERLPGAPFTTSTLQQEASRKLGYNVKMTMDVAQRLYQNGHITYMRTDSVNLSDGAISSARDFIEREFGSEYSLPNGRKYKTKQASAQEAHEAIRPTDITQSPDRIHLDSAELKLYKLIWERTVASQMREALIETTTYHFTMSGESDDWIVKGEVIKFPGFMKLYIEGSDDEEDDESESKKLPSIDIGSLLSSDTVRSGQKFSLPPARYTEAALVKKLESEGIGRPSTYAPTIQTIQDRGYVVIESKKLVPTDIAFVVTDYLEKEFPNFMQYSFTAEVERQFDQIAEGVLPWQEMLWAFYEPFHSAIDRALGSEGKFAGERILGKDESTGHTVLTRMSRYGPVVQIGSSEEMSEGEKPRYANLSAGMSMDDVTLDDALKLFQFPKEIGSYEDKPLSIGQGRYGPYIKWGDEYVSIPRGEDPHSIDQDRSIELIEAKKIENAPVGYYEGEPFTKGKGRFGPFLKWKSLYVNIPKSIDPETITSDEAVKLIQAKADKEANRYIVVWEEEKISIENGRYGPYIKFGKENLYLKKDGKKITDKEAILALSLEDVKSIITEQVPHAFGAKKKTDKKAKSETEKREKQAKKTKSTAKKPASKKTKKKETE